MPVFGALPWVKSGGGRYLGTNSGLALPGDESGESLGGFGADRAAHQRGPAEQRALETEGHAGPAPQVETIAMHRNATVVEFEFGVDLVDHQPAGLAESVGGGPVRAAGPLVGDDIPDHNFQVGRTPGQQTTTGQVINQANQTAVKNNLITSEKAATTQAVGDAVTLLGNLNIFKKSTNKLKGIDAVVMGTLSEYQSNFRLVVKVLDINNDNEIIAQGKGDFVKTKSFVEMWSEKIAKTNGSGGLLGGAANGDAMQIFKKDNLKFELMECYQSGQTFECVFQITNEGNDDLNLNVYNRESRAINAQSGYEYNVATIKLADKINSNEVSKTLIANSPIKAILSFDMKGGTVENLSKIEVKCWADKIGYFHAEMRNVQVK